MVLEAVLRNSNSVGVLCLKFPRTLDKTVFETYMELQGKTTPKSSTLKKKNAAQVVK